MLMWTIFKIERSRFFFTCITISFPEWFFMILHGLKGKCTVSGRTLQMGDVQKVNARLSTFISCDSKMKAKHNTKIFSNTYKLYLKTFTYNNVCLNNFQWLYDQILWRSACLPVYLSVLPVSYMKTTFMSYCL